MLLQGNGLIEAQRKYLFTNNGIGTFSSEKLPGGESKTHSIAVGNLMNEEAFDIVVGNHNETIIFCKMTELNFK